MDIAIMGATGCVGSELVRKLKDNPAYKVTASFRHCAGSPLGATWKTVDLNSPGSCADFLKGSDILVYLIHSLSDKNFEKIDLQFAQTTARAAKQAGIKKIIYLGGVMPKSGKLSPHLKSRRDVGLALAQSGLPMAELRASILLGAGSISYKIVYNLAKRLPVMVTPSWLKSCCAPIALTDAADAIVSLLNRNIKGHEIFEIGSETMRYKDLLRLCGRHIHGYKNLVITLPYLPFQKTLSSVWVSLFAGVPRQTASALIGSLIDDTVPTNNRFCELTGRQAKSIDQVLEKLVK